MYYGVHRMLQSFPTRRSSDLVLNPRMQRPEKQRQDEEQRGNGVQQPVVRRLLLAMRAEDDAVHDEQDRKSTRLNSSHSQISYAVFCLKTKNQSSQAECRPCYT